jgi:hypothetical protein
MRRCQVRETVYRGQPFRERLHAEWAVFLDGVGLAWHYVTEPFDFPGMFAYLPTFYVPKFDTYLEVRAGLPYEDFASADNFLRMTECGDDGGTRFTASGKFLFAEAALRTREGNRVHRRLYLLCGTPGVPRVRPYRDRWRLDDGAVFIAVEFVDPDYGPVMPLYAWAEIADELDIARYYLQPGPYTNGEVYDCPVFPKKTAGIVYIGDGSRTYRSPRLTEAYRAAGSARFEHGDRPLT